MKIYILCLYNSVQKFELCIKYGLQHELLKVDDDDDDQFYVAIRCTL